MVLRKHAPAFFCGVGKLRHATFLTTTFPWQGLSSLPPSTMEAEKRDPGNEVLTATGSERFSFSTCLHTTTFILLSIFFPIWMSSLEN